MDGANGSTTFTDSSPNALTVTAAGNAQISTTQKKYGTGAMYFDGTGDYVATGDHADFTLGSADFTVDFWFYVSGGAGTVRRLYGQSNSTGTLTTQANLVTGEAVGSLARANGTMNFLEQLSGRGNLIVNFGQKRYFEIDEPFKKCPIGAGVKVESYGGGAGVVAGTTPQIGYWYSQSADPRDRYLCTPPLFVERDSIIDASIQFLDTDYSSANYTLPDVNATVGSKCFVNVGLCFDGFAILPTQ
jgi:hypothetical protein